MKKLSLLVACIFVTSCTEKLSTKYSIPRETRVSTRSMVVGPKNIDTSVNVGGVSLSVSDTGPIVFSKVDVCEAAKIVLGQGLSLAYTCSASGKIGMAYPDGGSQRVLNGFVAAVRRSGVVVLVKDGVVILTHGKSNEGSIAEQSKPPSGLYGTKKVEGGYVRGELPESFEKRIKDKRANFGGLVARKIGADVDLFDAESIADTLGLDVAIEPLRGGLVALGSGNDLGILFAALAVGDVITFPVMVSEIKQAAVENYQSLYPRLNIKYDREGKTLWLSGSRDLVVKAFDEIRNNLPSLEDINVSLTFVSYTENAGKELSADLDAGFAFASGKISTGTVLDGYDFDLKLKHLVESGQGNILSKPRLRTTNGKSAVFNNGESVPVRISVDPETGAEQFEYRNTGVVVTVTPRKLGDGRIVLNVKVEISTVTGNGVGGNPVFSVRNVDTEVIINKGDVVSISGLDAKSVEVSNSKNFLIFGGSSRRSSKTSLAFFVSVS